MRVTLGDAKESGMAERLGLAQCSPEFLHLLKRAQNELAYMGKWWGTYARIRICASERCITWPRNVMSVVSLKSCSEKLRVRNEWYEFESFVDCDDCGSRVAMDGEATPIFGPIPLVPKKLRIYSYDPSDDDKIVHITGTSDGDHQVRSSLDDVFFNGEKLTLAEPYVESTEEFQTITGIQKPVTNAKIVLKTWDGTEEVTIGDYEPGETRPWYRRTYLTGAVYCSSAPTQTDRCEEVACGGELFKAIVRLKPIDPVSDTDWLHIGHLGALEDMIMSLQRAAKDMPKDAEAARARAVRSMRVWTDAMTGDTERTLITSNEDAGANRRTLCGFN